MRDDQIVASAEKLTGAHIYFDRVTVGAIINVMMAAVLAEGKTTLENSAKEPHVERRVAIITSVEHLIGSQIIVPDLRAGAALVIAGLAAEGITTIDDIVYIQRGYEDFDGKIRELGGMI